MEIGKQKSSRSIFFRAYHPGQNWVTGLRARRAVKRPFRSLHRIAKKPMKEHEVLSARIDQKIRQPPLSGSAERRIETWGQLDK